MTVPIAPANPNAAAGNGMVLLTWTPGSQDALTYTATSSPGGFVVTVPASSLQAVFPDVVNGTPYTFTIIASNSDGNSDPSVASNSATPDPIPGALANIFTLVYAQLARDYQYNSLSPLPEMQLGGQYNFENSDAPRIVFVPKTAKWAGSAHFGDGINKPIQLWDRRLLVHCYCWGSAPATSNPWGDANANYGAAEVIMNNLAASIHAIAVGASIPQGEEWPKSDAANLTRGALVILPVLFEIPATDYPPITVQLTHVTQDVVLLSE